MIDTREITKKSGPIRILAVDDNPAALYATSRVLRSAGYEVIEVTTGAAALRAAPGTDLVVLDVNLPDIDGFEVCRRLRADAEAAQIPVLHLSATFTNSADYAQGFEAGADGYLTRPVEPPVLLATVRTLLFAHHADLIRRGTDARLRTMFNLAPVAIAILDDKRRIQSVNPAYCALAGSPPEDLIGLDAAPIVGAGAADHAAGRSALARKNGTTAEIDWQIATESVTGTCILVATDVTHQLQAERARESLLASERAARSEAERSNRLKEEFLATLSHELRNPLNAILGWATILSRKRDLPPPVVQGLEAIERNSRIQARMISDLLDYAGISFGKVHLALEILDPYPIVRSTIEAVRESSRATGVELRAVFDDEPLRIEADAGRLQQIVWNLLTNAVKFSPQGAAVDVLAARHEQSFRLVVSDRGKGIEPEFLPRIFDRFSQQDATTTRSHGGLGLGMAIVKQLTDLHGGTIRAASAGRGKGATFTLEIPLSAGEPAAPGLSSSQTLRAMDFSQVVALVVEDDDDARALTRRILTDVGATVVEASDADSAVARVVSSKPSILISDIGMAREDGYQLLRRLRELGYGPDVLPAIALTAFARSEDRGAALAAGFQDHMVKPVDPQTLVLRIAALCGPRPA
jgi:hypothetical protein